MQQEQPQGFDIGMHLAVWASFGLQWISCRFFIYLAEAALGPQKSLLGWFKALATPREVMNSKSFHEPR